MPKQNTMASRMLLFPEPFRPVIYPLVRVILESAYFELLTELNESSHPDITVRTAYDLNPSIITSTIRMLSFVVSVVVEVGQC
jgi:hypothetical protein